MNAFRSRCIHFDSLIRNVSIHVTLCGISFKLCDEKNDSCQLFLNLATILLIHFLEEFGERDAEIVA